MLSKNASRRNVLIRASSACAAIVVSLVDPFGVRSNRTARAWAPDPEQGEEYHGLILLKPGAIRPALPNSFGTAPPILEKIGDGPNPTGFTRELTLEQASVFQTPLWGVVGLPVTKIEAAFNGSSLFDLRTVSEDRSRGLVVEINTQPNQSRPYPVPVGGIPEKPILPTKTSLTPEPGVVWTTPWQTVAIWADDQALFTLCARLSEPGQAPPLETLPLHRVQ